MNASLFVHKLASSLTAVSLSILGFTEEYDAFRRPW